MEDLYESDAGQSDSKPTGDGDGDQKSEGDSKTFLLNKEVCPGMSVGDKGSFRIERELESEYECSYQKEDKEEQSEPEPAMAPSGESDGMFD